MTHDLIQAALMARADRHEQALSHGTADDSTTPHSLVLRYSDTEIMRRRNHGPRLLAAAAAIAVAAIAGGIALGNTDDNASVGSTGDSAGTVQEQGTDADDGDSPSAPQGVAPAAEDRQREALTEQAARNHLEQFLAALDRQDYAAAERMLGGADMAADVVAALRPEPDDGPGEALTRYCAQELTFCIGLSVTESASDNETVRTFLVTTPIPAGALGSGEPASADVEQSTPFRVDQVKGKLRVLDLPPTHDDPRAES